MTFFRVLCQSFGLAYLIIATSSITPDVTLVVQRYVVGVDGGASKTVALIGTANGRILGRGESGPSNYHNIGARAAARSIKKAVFQAMKRAGLTGVKPAIAVVALAAIDSPKDRISARSFVRDAKISRISFVVHDSVAALFAATRGRPGMIVISGTGSVAAGINGAGRYARAGGWGYLVDDEGSAYDVGRKALNRAFRAIDGRSPPTQLVSILRRRFKTKTLEDAQKRIYSDGMSVGEIARLAPLVSEAAVRDKACREILADAGIRLAELACAVARRLKMTNEQVTVSVVGGNFKSGLPLLRPFQARIRSECPRARIAKLRLEPARGALALAASEARTRHERRPRDVEWLRF
jgi:N-acetylglucosamine kinase-like BadF-type ATPase